MRRKFSERYGYQKVQDTFQLNNINEALKNRLWNTIKIYYIDTMPQIQYSNNIDEKSYSFAKKIYDGFFKIHEEPPINRNFFKNDLKRRYFQLQWFGIYDLLEYISSTFDNEELNVKFRIQINEVLINEISGYRFIDKLIAPIINDIEIKEIEEALSCKYSGVKIHLSNSLEFLSDKENPDYVNSIKESISAVESAVNLISNKKNIALNKCLQYIPYDIDKNFKNAFIKLYSWTSSADGIRHGVTEEKIKSSFAEAKYMLVSCSAFINYLIEKQKEHNKN